MFGYQSVRGFIFCAKTTVNNGFLKKTHKIRGCAKFLYIKFKY